VNISSGALAPKISRSGLNVTILPGTIYAGTTLTVFPATNVTIIQNSTNYIFVNTGSSTIQVNQTGFPSTSCYPIATAVAGVSEITSLTDSRPDFFLAGSSSGVSTRSLQFVIDGGGAVPSTGAKGQISLPYACTITGWVLTADQAGSAVIDVLRSTYAAFPTTASIAGTDKPTLTAVQKNENLGPLSNWGSTAINAGDEIQINVGSATTVTRLNLTLNVTTP